MKFYLAREGVAFGPYTEFQVRESVRLGIFEQVDLALADDGKEWSTVAQLLPPPGVEQIDASLHDPVSAPLKPPVIGVVPPVRSAPLLPWRLAWAVPVVLAFCVAGGWGVSHHGPTAKKSAPAQIASVEIPVTTVRPEPSPRPTADDMALPARESMTSVPPEASTVANSQVLPAESVQKAVPTEETPKAPGPQHVVEGQINIAARNGRTYEPSEVEVRLYSTTLLKPYLEKRGLEANARYDEIGEQLKGAETEKENLRKNADVAFAAYTAAEPDAANRQELASASAEAKKAREKAANDYYNLRQEREEVLSGAFYLENLPPAAIVTRTDSQGKFHLAVPDDGEFAIVAGTQRGGDGAERYYWFVPVNLTNLTGEPGKTLLLSNNNTTAHGSAESLVQTVD